MRRRTHISSPFRPGACTLLSCIALACLAPSDRAHAETTLSVVGSGQVREHAHRREIQLSPHTIEVTETITLANSGRGAVEALYVFHLPAQAAVYELIVETPDGDKSRYGVVDANASTRLVADPTEESSPDLGLLRMVAVQGVGDRAERRYELRVFPIPAQKSSKVLIRWRSPVSLVAGRYSVRIPGRGEAPALARSEIQLRTTMATSELYGGDGVLARDAARNKRYPFFEPPEGDLVIQAKARVSHSRAHAEVALYRLSANAGVAALRVVLPDAAQGVVPRFHRALVIVDVSRSVGTEGRAAASKFVDSLLAEMGTGTQVEAILFHRSATQVLGELQAGSSAVRGQIVRAIRSASDKNGSDLKGALALGRKVLEHDRKDSSGARRHDTLIAIVGDGLLPTTLKAEQAIESLGNKLVGESRILSAILVPPHAPLPALGNHPLSALAYRGQGRVAALHYAKATQQGKALLSELAQPQPLDTLEVELDRGHWVGADLMGAAAPGSSVTALGYYEGGTPRRVTVLANQAGKRLRLVAQKLSRAEAKRLAQMALANTSPDSFPGSDQAPENRLDFVRAAASLGVITEVSAGIAIDKGDGFANDRLKLATRWGGQYYRRLPPPAERGAKRHHFQPFEIAAMAGQQDSRGRTGVLDRAIITRRVRTHAIPLARGCYDKLLRRDHRAQGSLILRIEIGRGEVHHAAVHQLSLALEPIRDCITDAIYAMPIPRVRQGSDPEHVNVVNYPLRLRLRKPGKGKVVEGATTTPADSIDPSDPLFGVPD